MSLGPQAGSEWYSIRRASWGLMYINAGGGEFGQHQDCLIAEDELRVANWLPYGKRSAVCFTIDDVHPGKTSDAYEAGGDLGDGALCHVEWLVRRHPQLKVTLFVTASWREINPATERTLLAKVPWLRDRFYLANVLPRDRMRLSNHPAFVRYLKSLPNVEVGLHGLYHARKGLNLPAEFRGLDNAACGRMLRAMMLAFEEASLPFVPGMCPPCWDLSDDLAAAMLDCGLRFVGSARDLNTPIGPDAVTAMSGRRGVSLIYPELIRLEGFSDGLLHMTSNFQATSAVDRALQIVEAGGLVGIKAHIIKSAFGHVALDGLDEVYRNYLDLVLSELEDKYGNAIWWTSMSEIAATQALGATRSAEQPGLVNC
jgi:hypothetical protein